MTAIDEPPQQRGEPASDGVQGISVRRTPLGVLVGLVRGMRPRQWVKNLLVYAVPLAAGLLRDRDVWVDATVAFVCFCLAASAIYLLNDVVDAEADRAHPVKRTRPIASGLVPVPLALTAAVVLTIAALAGAVVSTYPGFVLTLVVYLVVTLGYSLGLKNEPVIEMVAVAIGFVLRATAGGTATGIPISPWFLTVAAFGSLFMVAGKRYSEFVSLGDTVEDTRRTLLQYSAPYLRFVWTVSAGIMLTGYCLWAFQIGLRDRGNLPLAAWSAVPFVLAVLRYALDIDRGVAGAPEEIALHDRVLQVVAVSWLVIFAFGAQGW